jgi:hypothetical protein
MTIKELKKLLRGYPDDTEILVKHYDGWGNPHKLPCMDETEIIADEQNGSFYTAIVLEANIDAMLSDNVNLNI